MQKILQTAVSSVIAIIALFILTRMMGKKQMAQLNFFDYVVGISIGSIASEYAVVRDIHLAEGLTSLVVFTIFSVVLSYISIKSYRWRKILDGTSSILIENGRILEPNLKKAQININDLLEECRQKDIFDIAAVEFAILETSGRLSILPKFPNRPLTPKDMQIPAKYEGLCTNIIIDGRIIKGQLKAINRDTSWLQLELTNKGFNTPADILLAYVNTAGDLHIHPKTVINKTSPSYIDL